MDATQYVVGFFIAYAFLSGLTFALLEKNGTGATWQWAILWPLSLPFAIGALAVKFFMTTQPPAIAKVQRKEANEPSKDMVDVTADRLDSLEKSVSRIEALLKQHQRDNTKKKGRAVEEKIEQRTLIADIPDKSEVPKD